MVPLIFEFVNKTQLFLNPLVYHSIEPEKSSCKTFIFFPESHLSCSSFPFFQFTLSISNIFFQGLSIEQYIPICFRWRFFSLCRRVVSVSIKWNNSPRKIQCLIIFCSDNWRNFDWLSLRSIRISKQQLLRLRAFCFKNCERILQYRIYQWLITLKINNDLVGAAPVLSKASQIQSGPVGWSSMSNAVGIVIRYGIFDLFTVCGNYYSRCSATYCFFYYSANHWFSHNISEHFFRKSSWL